MVPIYITLGFLDTGGPLGLGFGVKNVWSLILVFGDGFKYMGVPADFILGVIVAVSICEIKNKCLFLNK